MPHRNGVELDKRAFFRYYQWRLPGGVMVAQMTLDHPFKVRVLARQPFVYKSRLLIKRAAFLSLARALPGFSRKHSTVLTIIPG